MHKLCTGSRTPSGLLSTGCPKVRPRGSLHWWTTGSYGCRSVLEETARHPPVVSGVHRSTVGYSTTVREGATVSITDDVRGGRPAGPPQDGPPPQRDGGYDKTPPQDVAAEQSVLGGMLLSKDAIADVIEILKTGDFYRPIHATVFDAILDLYGRGEPADAVTVAAALADSGDIMRIGGAPYLQTLMASVPTAANAGYYARIVAERAVLRRLVEAGTRIVQLGYGSASGGGRDVDDVVDLAQQAIYDVTGRRTGQDFAALAE